MTIELRSRRRGNLLGTLAGNPEHLTAAISEKLHMDPNRIWLTLSQERGAKRVTDATVPSNVSVLYVKDLGPQVGYRTLFVVEYLGPLVLYALLYLRNPAPSPAQTYAFYAWSLHFLKREFETFFVHRFSHATCPRFNLVKNSVYYWGASVIVGWTLNDPRYTPPTHSHATLLYALMALCELLNALAHLTLRNLRQPGETTRRIPRGALFALVSCPNYLFEVLGWVAFACATSSLPAGLFAVVGCGQMMVWAAGKHRRYRKDFGKEYPRGRKAMIPFVF